MKGGGGNRESSGGSSFYLSITAPQTTWLLCPPSNSPVLMSIKELMTSSPSRSTKIQIKAKAKQVVMSPVIFFVYNHLKLKVRTSVLSQSSEFFPIKGSSSARKVPSL